MDKRPKIKKRVESIIELQFRIKEINYIIDNYRGWFTYRTLKNRIKYLRSKINKFSGL
jgi:hypothetical protein